MKSEKILNFMKSSRLSESDPIVIDNNWSDALSAGICTGSGKYSDPYMIQGLGIDGNDEVNCITIRNSKAYFIIKKCGLWYSGFQKGGIFLHNVTNAQIIDNACYSNFHGIYITHGKNISLIENTMRENRYGIMGNNCDNCTLLHNSIWSYTDGIGLYNGSDYNKIIENKIYETRFWGIHFYSKCDHNFLYKNYVNATEIGIINIRSDFNRIIDNEIHSQKFGIYFEFGDFNNISSNKMINCGLFIKRIDSCTNTISRTNVVNNKSLYFYQNMTYLSSQNFSNPGQIILVGCANTSISFMNFSFASVGINLYRCTSINITHTILNDNEFGITTWNCKNLLIMHNEMYYNYYGLYSSLDVKNYYFNNTNSFNYIGFGLKEVNESDIKHNTANNNILSGISLEFCYNNLISRNTANYNKYGIDLDDCFNNSIINNTLIGNKICIKISDDSRGNILKDNDCRNIPSIHGYNQIYIILIFFISTIGLVVISLKIKHPCYSEDH